MALQETEHNGPVHVHDLESTAVVITATHSNYIHCICVRLWCQPTWSLNQWFFFFKSPVQFWSSTIKAPCSCWRLLWLADKYMCKSKLHVKVWMTLGTNSQSEFEIYGSLNFQPKVQDKRIHEGRSGTSRLGTAWYSGMPSDCQLSAWEIFCICVHVFYTPVRTPGWEIHRKNKIDFSPTPYLYMSITTNRIKGNIQKWPTAHLVHW